MIRIVAYLTYLMPLIASANNLSAAGLNISFGDNLNLVDTMQVLALFTVLTLAPAFIILCTSFTRIVVVLSFMRQAIGTQNLPPNQVILGFALFLSVFVMMPTGSNIYQYAIKPYTEEKITAMEALSVMEKSMRVFMEKHVRRADVAIFYDVTSEPKPDEIGDVPIHFLIPSFIISELKTAFQIGFLLYVPFLILDMVVASVLMAMGMMMLPPVLVSLPFKLLLFVLVDGWQLVTGAILKSFHS